MRKTFLLILLVETSIQFNFIDLIIDNYQWCFNFKNSIELIKSMPVLNLMSLDKSCHSATVPCRKKIFFLLLAKLFPCCSTSCRIDRNLVIVTDTGPNHKAAIVMNIKIMTLDIWFYACPKYSTSGVTKSQHFK